MFMIDLTMGLANPTIQSPRSLGDACVSVVIPAFNESDNLTVLLPKLQQILTDLGSDWEVLVVDDGSVDATALLMQTWSGNLGFRFIQLSRNFGKEAALTAGIEAAQGDVVVLMDADLQHPPELISEMVTCWESGVDMVYAVRTSREDEPWLKRVGTKLFYSLLRTEQGVQVPPHAGDFRLMDRAVVQSLLMLPERNRFMKGLYAWVGFRTQALPYKPQGRHAGRSHFDVFKLWRLALAGLMSFTTWPLRAVSIVGFVVSFCALMYGIFIVIKHLMFASDVAGWPTIVTILLFFSGINLLSLGIVGEYVARIFEEVKARPIYLIQQQKGSAARGKGPKATKNEGQDGNANQNHPKQ
jgi:polyisoprenyl-phosphate glycosyltransferase